MFFFWTIALALAAMFGGGGTAAGDSVSDPASVTYVNPISPFAETAWQDYGFGDPYVFRFNGRYYLYPSTRDDEIGVKCWSSRDLVHWNYEGLCSTEPLTKGAYAPEVVYGNGAFYMYTSPGGRGHYVLKSDAPTGPFVLVTGNVGFSIDGSVFIDDDGAWYFYHAFERGILGHRMSAPDQIDPSPVPVGAFMNGWTEGPMVVKQDGIYYLTYTGNHVFSRGYRIDAGTGDSPLRFFPTAKNPILISTQDALYGIGHSSTVKGPNLDLYYLVYHSRIGSGKRGWPVREMNIDRLVFNRDRLSVVGPTRTEQTIPLADWALWFETGDDLKRLRTIPFPPALYGAKTKSGGESSASQTALAAHVGGERLHLAPNQAVLSDHCFEGNFTAEFHLATPNADAKAGCLFCYVDPKNYGSVEVCGDSGRMTLALVTNGDVQSREIELPKSFGKNLSFTTLQAIQIERTGETFTFYVNDRWVGEWRSPLDSGMLESGALGSGAIGYYSRHAEALFGFLGGTAATGGGSAAVLAQPIPGTVSFCSQKTRGGKSPVERNFPDEGRLLIHALEEGESLTTELDVTESGDYDLILSGASADAGTVELTIDGAPGGPIRWQQAGEQQAGGEDSRRLTSTVRRDIALESGKKRLEIRCQTGKFDLSEIAFVRHDAVEPLGEGGAPLLEDFTYSDGAWKEENGALIAEGPAFFGKRLCGADGWGDYRVEADVVFLGKPRNAGILVRAQNPSLGGPNSSAEQGTDFFQGYFIGFGPHSVQLAKHNYNWIPLQERRWDFAAQDRLHVSVVAQGATITVEIDGQKALEFTEAHPFFTGRAGVRTCGTPVQFENFRVFPLEKAPR